MPRRRSFPGRNRDMCARGSGNENSDLPCFYRSYLQYYVLFTTIPERAKYIIQVYPFIPFYPFFVFSFMLIILFLISKNYINEIIRETRNITNICNPKIFFVNNIKGFNILFLQIRR